MTKKIESRIKTALLAGEEYRAANGWLMKINAQDNVEIWPPKGEGMETTLAHLDTAIADFCKRADVYEPSVNQTQGKPSKVTDGDLGKDTSTKDTKKLDAPEKSPRPKPQGPKTPTSLGSDSSTKPGFSDPAINKRPKQKVNPGDPSLGPDSSSKSTNWGDKVVKIKSDGRTGQRAPDPENYAYQAAWLHNDKGRSVPWNREEYSEFSEDQDHILYGYQLGYVRNDSFGAGEEIIDDPTVKDLPLFDEVNPETNKDEEGEEEEFVTASRSKITDTFSSGPDPSEIYRNLKAKRPSKEMLEDIMDPEKWVANRVFAQMTEHKPKRGPGMLGKGKGTYADGDAGGQLGSGCEAEKEAVAPEGWEETVKKMKKHPEIDNPYALTNYMENEGMTPGGKDKKSTKTAGPKLREKWLGDGGYHREIESESAEELHALVRGFGGEEVDWSKFKPTMPEEDKEAADGVDPAAEAPNPSTQTAKKAEKTKIVEIAVSDEAAGDWGENQANFNGYLKNLIESALEDEFQFSDEIDFRIKVGGGEDYVRTKGFTLSQPEGSGGDEQTLYEDIKRLLDTVWERANTTFDPEPPVSHYTSSKKAQGFGGVDLHKAVYAQEEGGHRNRVKPIYNGEALATLEDEETGEKIRIPITDLLEFYTLFDMDEQIIHSPEVQEFDYAEKNAQSADVEAVDEEAKDVITKYMGDYGKELTKDDGVAPKKDDPKKKLKRAQSDWEDDEYEEDWGSDESIPWREKVTQEQVDQSIEDVKKPKKYPEKNLLGIPYWKAPRKKAQAETLAPAAPAGSQPSTPSVQQNPQNPAGAKPPVAPEQKKGPASQTQLQPGVGDAGIQALGWTKEDVQAMTDDQKQKILQVQLSKPGTVPKTQAPAQQKAPAPAAPKAPPPSQPNSPVPAPGAEPAPPAPVQPAPKAVKGGKGRKRSQAAPQALEEEAPAPAPQTPAAPAPKAPAAPQANPTTKPGADGGDEQRAFQILQEVQKQPVEAATPNEISTAKASLLMQRLSMELGMGASEAAKLFGLPRGNLTALFK